MKTQAILDTLKTVPAFAAIMQEMEDNGLAERQILIDRLAELDAESAAKFQPLADEVERLTVEVEDLTHRLRIANYAKGVAVARMFNTSSKVTRERKMLEATIRAGADVRLNNFQVWAERAANLANYSSFFAEPMGYSGPVPSNNAARAALLARKIKKLCRDAISRADELRLESLSAADIGLELEAMTAGIYEEFQKLPSGSTLYQIPSDYLAPLM